ncbi:hypothetical protein SESBI_33113 [Sesbania bispinosa]|nr:hypothetical protein SESBI_33113 [Sesbania bispinosa]
MQNSSCPAMLRLITWRKSARACVNPAVRFSQIFNHHFPIFNDVTKSIIVIQKILNLIEFLNEDSANLSVQNVIEKIAKQSIVVVETLKRDFLFNKISVVHHCHLIGPNQKHRRIRKKKLERESGGRV